MKAITSRLRGWNATTKSSSPISAAPRSSVRDRSHGYWLCSTIAHRISASSSGTLLVGVEDVLGAGTPGSPGRARASRTSARRAGSRNSATVGLIGGSSVAWCSLLRNRSNSRLNTVFSVSAIPRGRQLTEGALDRGDLALAVLPRGQHRQEHVVAALRQVAPARRPLVEHGDRVPVGPEQVLAQIAQQFEAPRVGPGLEPGQDFGPGRRLRLEIPPITAVNWSSVSSTEKSRSPRKLAGNTRRPCRLITNDFTCHLAASCGLPRLHAAMTSAAGCDPGSAGRT